MAFNFVDSVKGYFSNDLVNKAASFLGESETSIKKGLDAIIPVSLAGIVNKAQSSPESLFGFAKEAFSSGIVNKLGDTFRPGGGGVPSMGPPLISGVLGDKFGSIANSISSFTGLKGSSISSLFGSIVPFALGLLGKQATENNLSPGAVSTMLSSQKSSIMSMIPSGLNLSNLLGLGGVKQAVSSAVPEIRKRRTNWVLPILLGIAALFLLWWLFSKPDKTTTGVVPMKDTTTAVNKPVEPTVTMGTVKLKLPNGVELDAYKGGIEDQLIAFINDPASKPGKDVWFDFNDLNFKFGTAEIMPESQKQLDNITKILQAYPKVKIKIGGYTDKVGDEAANKKLSHGRAKAVADALNASGVGSQVTGAEGYGSQFAKYPADAPESDRVKDRRVSVSVREK